MQQSSSFANIVSASVRVNTDVSDCLRLGRTGLAHNIRVFFPACTLLQLCCVQKCSQKATRDHSVSVRAARLPESWAAMNDGD